MNENYNVTLLNKYKIHKELINVIVGEWNITILSECSGNYNSIIWFTLENIYNMPWECLNCGLRNKDVIGECEECFTDKETATTMIVKEKKNMCRDCGHKHREGQYCHVYCEMDDDWDDDGDGEEDGEDGDGDDGSDDGLGLTKLRVRQDKPLPTPVSQCQCREPNICNIYST